VEPPDRLAQHHVARVRNPDNKEWLALAKNSARLGGLKAPHDGLKQDIRMGNLELIHHVVFVCLGMHGLETFVCLSQPRIRRRESAVVPMCPLIDRETVVAVLTVGARDLDVSLGVGCCYEAVDVIRLTGEQSIAVKLGAA